MKRFSAAMHHNTIDELLRQGEPKENMKHFDFDSVTEAYNFDFPYHRDNYILVQWDFSKGPDGSGAFDTLADAYMFELEGSEADLSGFREY